MSINIIEGSEFAVLFDKSTGAELGSTTQLSDYDNISNVGIKRINNAPKAQTIQSVKVESNINGVKDTSEIYYFPEESEIETEIYPEAITIGERSNIHVRLYNYCNISFETKINLMIIKGSEYGSLIDPYTNERTKTLTNLDNWWGNVWVDYIADGKSPLKTDSVIIRISTSDSTIVTKELTFYINPSPIYVYTNPEVVSAADTAEVIIKKRNPDGSLEDFPSGQTFELSVVDGCINGNILVGDSLGVYFSDAQEPIYFVAADSVAGDSGIVRLRVGTDLGDAAMQPMIKIAKQDNEITEEQKKLSELKAGYKKMIEKKKAELNQSKLSLNEQLKSNAPITEACYIGGYLYETGYWKGDVAVGDAIEINYVSGDRFIEGTPKMPSISFSAIPKFEIIGSFNLDWELEVKWIDERDTPYRTTIEKFRGQESGFGNGLIYWTIPWGEKIIGGDEIKITGTIVYNGFTYTTSKKLNMRIIGKNPTPADVKNGLNIHEQIVVYLESRPKWKHFNESGSIRGYPIWGSPHGYGLMQIDPPHNNAQIWNWRVSREEGKQRLNEKKQKALNYPSTIRNGTDSRKSWYPRFRNKKSYSRVTDFVDDINNEQLWKETHHRYRGGSYWRWYPDDPRDQNSTGEWRAEPQKGHTRGMDAWQMKIDVESGNYPELWN